VFFLLAGVNQVGRFPSEQSEALLRLFNGAQVVDGRGIHAMISHVESHIIVQRSNI
jgi:hypothetical protein